MNQFWNPGVVRDYWPRYTPAAIQNLSWLDAVDCFKPKLFVGPNEAEVSIPASGYKVIPFALLPGSWVIGFTQIGSDAVDFQLTDVGASFKFFSSPASAAMISNVGGYFMPFWIPEPYMLIAPAILKLEMWNNNSTATTNSQIVVHVLEPREV